MSKAAFEELLRREGYQVERDAAYPTVIVMEGKKRETYNKVKLLAIKVGYNHTFGIKESNIETRVIDGPPETEIETKVVDWPEEENDAT